MPKIINFLITVFKIDFSQNGFFTSKIETSSTRLKINQFFFSFEPQTLAKILVDQIFHMCFLGGENSKILLSIGCIFETCDLILVLNTTRRKFQNSVRPKCRDIQAL